MKTRYDVHSLIALGGYIVYVALVVAIIVLVSCNKSDTANTRHELVQEAQQPIQNVSFQKDAMQKSILNLLVQHYWKNFNISELATANLNQLADKFIDITAYADDTAVAAAITESLEKSTGNKETQAYLLELYELYFYNPNSPYRNDEYYIPILRYIIDSKNTNDGDKARAEFRLKMALKTE